MTFYLHFDATAHDVVSTGPVSFLAPNPTRCRDY
jgi:hypothetical protein